MKKDTQSVILASILAVEGFATIVASFMMLNLWGFLLSILLAAFGSVVLALSLYFLFGRDE